MYLFLIYIFIKLQDQKDDKRKPHSYNDIVDKSDEKYTENNQGKE